MRRKRLQHAAHTLCQMFCGWRLINSYNDLVDLGTGRLRINALTGGCSFDGVPISPLSIAEELQGWLRGDLAAHAIPETGVERAQVTADLRFARIDSAERRTEDHHFDRDQRPIRTGEFHRLVISCFAEIATDERIYAASFEDLEEWPVGWLTGG